MSAAQGRSARRRRTTPRVRERAYRPGGGRGRRSAARVREKLRQRAPISEENGSRFEAEATGGTSLSRAETLSVHEGKYTTHKVPLRDVGDVK